MMKKTLVAGMMAAAASVMVPGLAGAEAVTADVPVGSVYYDYVDKLSGMGYIDSLPDGARPYSRMQMAKWVLQAEKNAKDRPMPAYLADELASMRTAFASEIEVLKGRSDQDDLALRQASLQLASYNSDQSSYKQSMNAAMVSRMQSGSRLARARMATTTPTASTPSPRRSSRATSAIRRPSR